MQIRKSDPLLDAAKVLSVIIQIIIVLAMVGIGLAIGVMSTIGRDRLIAELAKLGAPENAVWIAPLFLILTMVMLGLAHRFFKTLDGIIDTVRRGDPFRSDNADRLVRMGWLSVAAQVLGLVLGWFSARAEPYIEKAGHSADLGFGFDITGVLLTLTLFILARVFRLGAAMRDELEGTV